MKNNKVAVFVKHVVSVLSALAKSKSIAIRNKAGAIKARAELFSLMKSRKLSLQGRLGIGAISNKINALLGQHAHDDDDGDDKAIVVVSAISNAAASESTGTIDQRETAETMSGHNQYLLEYRYDDDDEDDKYPDLRHSLFEEEEEELLRDDPNASVIDMVRSSKEDEGEMFSLEDEIDHVADLFIRNFHKRMRLQKLESFKRLQEMIRRGA